MPPLLAVKMLFAFKNILQAGYEETIVLIFTYAEYSE